MKRILIASVLSLFIISISSNAHSAIPITERNALIDMYSDMNGESWTNSTNWNGPAESECSWHGITCDAGENNVTQISLSYNNVSGEIPSSIGNFPELQGLYLSENYNITGSIPSTIGNLTKLVNLWLGYNNLTGPIPIEIGNCTLLYTLSLTSNSLEGTIPAEVEYLTHLNVLDLNGNELNGTIPASLGKLLSLRSLLLFNNQLTGAVPPELGDLSNLDTLSLGNNLLTSIPSDLGKLTKLTGLSLEGNLLDGPIPTFLEDLENLLSLNLGYNQFSGSIPTALFNMTKLENLNLNDNQLTGGIPAGLNALTNLRSLYLSRNPLGGSIPEELGELGALSNLQLLYLSSTQLTGTIPPAIGNLLNLTALSLDDNQLTDAIPNDIGKLTHLVSLNLGNNQLDGPLPPAMGGLADLSYLFIENNNISGGIPTEFEDLASIRIFSLYNNSLTGAIPSELGNLTTMTYLNLQGNALVGEIPSSLVNLVNLYNNNNSILYNGLYADTADIVLRDFLDTKMIGVWEQHQTVAPINLSAGTPEATAIPLSWSAIPYTFDAGGYEVYYATISGGPYTLFETTLDKSIESTTVTGLVPETTYFFRLRSVTYSNSNNQNDVYSEFSEEISATTASGGSTTTYYCDDDEDGYIDANPDGTCDTDGCEPSGCTTIPGTDCDDENGLVNPDGSESCDTIDNDCDGNVDEDFTDLGNACSVGTGICSAAGNFVCTADETGTECDAVPGSPTSEVCDGLDNDCDGTADETFVDLGNTCLVGIGICSAAGNYVCTVDETGTECDAVPGSPTTELCDGLDNDCDGIADEDFGNLGNACTVGVGVCSAAGNYVCTDDQANTECDATPGSPTTELCDGLDNDCDGATDEGCGAATITAWHIETVDYAGFVGTYTSIALDPSGNPHVSYMDYSNRGLKYAYYDGSIWNIETVDAVGDVGYYTSIALDPSGNPHISYFDNSNLDMKYAYYNGNVWNIETVDAAAVFGYKSMVLDPTGNPHVSYRDYSNQGLKYAYYDGSIWHIETVDAAYDVGYSTSIALDPSGNPHISYFDNSNRDLKYAYYDGSIWNIETVDYIGMGWHGWHASIALDSSGNPHISYLDAYPSQDLKYAYYNGSIWNIETVDAVGGDNGFFTSTALDPSGNPHISYLDGYPIRDLKYAYYDGSIWNIETVDSAGDVGWHSSMVLDPTGNPHVSYLDFSNLNLKYAYKEEVGISDSATVSTSEGDMTVSISEGSFAVAPAIVAPGFGIPDGFLTPYGALSYTISTDPGATVTVIVTLPEEPPPGTTLFKCINSVCSPIVGAIISGYNAVFDVTDGGSLDEDTIVNGEIVEPCVLAVPAHPEVAIDIKPGSCPNPLNIKSKGVLPAAIIGTEDFDVTRIDPASINLMGIAPLRWSLKDVATPYEPFTGKEEATDCTDAGPDGLADLTLKFDTQELVQTFELLLGVNLEDGEALVVRLTGNLREEFGSAQFIGEDVVVILKKK